jgi:dTDP-glucose pyrophosphorylase
VKVIILAAGKGSRMKGTFPQPKPLIEVNERPLVWWSLMSLHELVTCGLVQKSDIKIAVLAQDLQDFKKNRAISEYFQGCDPYIQIDKPTSGPVETALAVLRILQKEHKIQLDEKILISDSDHYARSINLRRNLEVVSDVFLWETDKDESLEWSFVSRKQDSFSIVEKPLSGKNIDVHRGLIGIYAFSRVADFLEAAEIEEEKFSEREIFLSNIVNILINRGKKVSISHVNNFFPMGTPYQLEACEGLPDPNLTLHDSKTFFFDIDGVVFLHNQSVHGNFPWEPDIPIESNVSKINLLFEDARIVLVTARPKKYETELTKRLRKHGVCFDEILSGCTGGVRILVNDLKPKLPFIRTAIAINSRRDQDLDLGEAFQEAIDISGGSGAKTVLMQSKRMSGIVYKFTNDVNMARILDYQASWYNYCNENNISNPVKVLERFDAKVACVGFATDFIPDLISFYQYSRNMDNEELWIPKLVSEFHLLYAHKFGPTNNETLLSRIIDEKVIPSITAASFRWPDDKYFQNLLRELREKFEYVKRKSIYLEMGFRGSRTVIHGDPTFENLQITKDGSKLYFLDPIGKMIEPQNPTRDLPFASYPVFDLARLDLSYRLNYEEHISMARDKDLTLEECHKLAVGSLKKASILETDMSDVFKEFDTVNLPIVLASTLGRILKYKTNAKEATILTIQAILLLDELLQ